MCSDKSQSEEQIRNSHLFRIPNWGFHIAEDGRNIFLKPSYSESSHASAVSNHCLKKIPEYEKVFSIT